jgi:predicted  nucleic acid-binding Zn-ribbon protein
MGKSEKRQKAKEYLKRYRYLVMRRQAIEKAIDETLEQATSTSASISPVTVKAGKVGSRVEDAVIRVVDQQKQLYKMQAEIDRTLAEITEVISRLEDERKRALLTMRYIAGDSWEDIREEMGYEADRCYVLHREALEELVIKS